MTRSGFRAEKARPVRRGFPLPGRPWWNPAQSLGAVQHHKRLSFSLSLKGIQALDKLNYSLVGLLCSVLLRPMTASWKQKCSPELRYNLRQVGDEVVHPTKEQNEFAVPGDV